MADEERDPQEANPTPDSGAGDQPADEKAQDETLDNVVEAAKKVGTGEPAVEAEVEAEPEDKEEPAVETAGLSDRLKAAALKAGYKEEELPSLSDPNATKLLERLADMHDADAKNAAELAKALKVAPKGDEGKTAEEVQKAAFNVSEPFRFSAIREDPDLAELFGDNTDQHILKPLEDFCNGLRAQVAEMLPFVQEAMSAKTREQGKTLDDFFKVCEPLYGDVLGKGPTSELDQETPQYAARKNLYEMAADIYEGRRKRGEEVPLADCYRDAAWILWPEKQKQAVRAELKGAATKQRAQITARPGGRRATAATGDKESAVERVAQIVKSSGLAE